MNYNRIFIYGMQSSGASLFTYFLGQISESIAIVDLWSHCIAPEIKTDKLCILKATINNEISLENHIKNYKPNFKILLVRNPIQNYLNLDVKHYRNWRGKAEHKFEMLEKIYSEKREVFKCIIRFEDFINNPMETVSTLNFLGINIPTKAIEFNRNYSTILNFNKKHSVWCRKNYEIKWAFGNIHFDNLKKLVLKNYQCNDIIIKNKISSLCPNILKLYDKDT